MTTIKTGYFGITGSPMAIRKDVAVK